MMDYHSYMFLYALFLPAYSIITQVIHARDTMSVAFPSVHPILAIAYHLKWQLLHVGA